MTRHTLGPWIVDGKWIRAAHAEGFGIIAEVNPGTEDNGRSNARLIAAAPQLLELAEMTLKCCRI
jgi:hypothetical protein